MDERNLCTWDAEFDLVVLGSGAAGLSASTVATTQGLSVLLCEKAAALGGTTATSGGAIWIPGSTQAIEAGLLDSIEDARRYLLEEAGPSGDAAMIGAYLETGRAAVDYFAKNTNLRFELAAVPDYHSSTSGSLSSGRVLVPAPFDARCLGKQFILIRAPMRRLMILGGMMVARHQIPILLRPFSSGRSMVTALRILSRYVADRLTYRRGTALYLGNALVAALVSTLLTRQVAIWINSTLHRLVMLNGVVVGAELITASGLKRVRVKGGVVLATGGMAASSALRDATFADWPHQYTLAAAENVGEGLAAALAVGATLDDTVTTPGLWTPASLTVEKGGTTAPFPYGYFDRGKPGAIAVDSRGKRFANESDSYHDVTVAMFASARKLKHLNVVAHLICDSEFISRYGLGAIRPRSMTLRWAVKSGYAKRASTIEGLAQALGVNPSTLSASVAQHNAYAATGVDLEFHKGESMYNRWNGDPTCEPNPCLRPIVKPPFYALTMHPATLGTVVGLSANTHAQVLDSNGRPIPGLYACGNDMTSITRGACVAGGITLGPALVFGYRAAMHVRDRLRTL